MELLKKKIFCWRSSIENGRKNSEYSSELPMELPNIHQKDSSKNFKNSANDMPKEFSHKLPKEIYTENVKNGTKKEQSKGFPNEITEDFPISNQRRNVQKNCQRN